MLEMIYVFMWRSLSYFLLCLLYFYLNDYGDAVS